jgi:hypothetical protein
VQPSAGLDPAPESDPGIRAPEHAGAVALPRFVSPTAQPDRPEPPLPGLPGPGHVASSRFLPASTPCSRNDLPDVFQPGALTGFTLQSLTLPGSHRLSAAHPLARLAARKRRGAASRSSGTIAGARDRRVVPLGASRPRLRGLDPPAGWGAASRISPVHGPWLSWVSPPWGLPLPGPRKPRSPRRPPPVLRKRHPFWVSLPVLQSVKEPGNRPGLSRGCLPLRGSCPRPEVPVGCPKEQRVSDRSPLRFTQTRNQPELLDSTRSGFLSLLAAKVLLRVTDSARTLPEELVNPASAPEPHDPA